MQLQADLCRRDFARATASRLIGETVAAVVSDRQRRVLYAGQEVARHVQSSLRRVSVIERSRLVGIVGAQFAGMSWRCARWPLKQYEAVLGGGW